MSSLSSVPVVGCRNYQTAKTTRHGESIKRSGGGVSEPLASLAMMQWGVYQAFRWWGVGTHRMLGQADEIVYQAFRWWGVGTWAPGVSDTALSLSSVPVVGCRNRLQRLPAELLESIKRSGGGVSEHRLPPSASSAGVYQAFRWWGVGTTRRRSRCWTKSLSSVPVVGCRNLDGGADLDGNSLSSVPVVGCRNFGIGWPLQGSESIKRSGGGVSERYVRLYQRLV